jgi:hypothetical protein
MRVALVRLFSSIVVANRRGGGVRRGDVWKRAFVKADLKRER